MSVPVKRDGAWQLSEPVKVCDLPESIYAGGAFGENAFDVTSDGQKFLMLQTTKDESSPQPLPKPSALVVENWFEEFHEKK